MKAYFDRHPFWSTVILILVAVLLWMVFAIWPEWLKEAIGRKSL